MNKQFLCKHGNETSFKPCDKCTIDRQQKHMAELERERDEAVDKAIRFDLDAAGITQREAESRELIELRAEVARLRAENTRLRAALAHSKSPCAYCSLPAEEWNKCAHGFPGCARADDAMGCPELGARLLLDEAQGEVARLREALDHISGFDCAESYTRSMCGSCPSCIANAALAREDE